MDDDSGACEFFHLSIAADMVHVAVRVDDGIDAQFVFCRQGENSMNVVGWINDQRVSGDGVPHQIGENRHVAHLHLLNKHDLISSILRGGKLA